MVQVVEHLPNKCTVSSNPCMPKKTKGKKKGKMAGARHGGTYL
jgi:hypothetical protein